MAKVHQAACFCGAVKLEAEGDPKAMGYCHCASCRTWSAGPVNAFTLWDPKTVKVTQSAIRRRGIGFLASNQDVRKSFTG